MIYRFLYKKIILLILFVTIANITAKSQDKWSLEQCVKYAIDNNIVVKQQTLNVNYKQNQYKQSKFDLIPNLNGSLGHSFSFGRSLTQYNTYTDKNSQNTDLSLNTSVTVFNGMSKQNTIKMRNLEMQAALQDLEKTKDDITLNVASAYLEILFNKELVAATKEQIKVTKEQIDYNKKQVEVGNMAKGKIFETEAQLAQEELTLTNYENKLKSSLLNLMQLLEIQVTDSFDIVTPEFNAELLDAQLLSTNSIYNKAVNERPEILSKELTLQSLEKAKAIAKAQLYPSLSMGASYYNNYNNEYQYFDGSGKIPFDEQVKNNRRTNLYVTLKIPLFNGFQTRTNLNNTIINYENSKYQLQLEKNNLMKQIQKVHLDAVSAMKKYYSSQKALESAQEAFRYVEEKFKLGIVTPLEYNDAKNKVTNAQSSFIQAKYEYIFRVKILDFYNGKEIVL